MLLHNEVLIDCTLLQKDPYKPVKGLLRPANTNINQNEYSNKPYREHTEPNEAQAVIQCQSKPDICTSTSCTRHKPRKEIRKNQSENPGRGRIDRPYPSRSQDTLLDLVSRDDSHTRIHHRVVVAKRIMSVVLINHAKSLSCDDETEPDRLGRESRQKCIRRQCCSSDRSQASPSEPEGRPLSFGIPGECPKPAPLSQ